MSKIASVLKVVAANLLLVFAGLVAVELAFGSWFSDTHPLYQFTKPRNLDIVKDNPFGDEPKQIRYTRDANGFRGLDGPVSEIDILTVGGSTTDQRYLDDNLTYQAVLRDLFLKQGKNLSIVNAGIDGQSTVGHIHNFSSWFSRIDNLKTRYILYYIGINDMLQFGEGNSYDNVEAGSFRLDWQLYIRDKSIFYQLYLILKQYNTPNPYAHGVTRDFVIDLSDAVETANVAEYGTEEVRNSLAALRERVRKLAQLTREMGASSIFVTQRSARWLKSDGKIFGIPGYIQGETSEFNRLGDVTGVDIYHMERLVADAIIKECEEVGDVCLDLMNEIEFDLRNDFYDPVHTTSSGSQAIGEFLFEKLRDRM